MCNRHSTTTFRLVFRPAVRLFHVPWIITRLLCVVIYLYFAWRSHWPRDLRRRFAAIRLLRLRVRILPVTWMPVSCECCQVEVSASGWSLVQRSPTECGVSVCDREASRIKTLWPTRGCRTMNFFFFVSEKYIELQIVPVFFMRWNCICRVKGSS
jgi:hypothetical protein